MANGREGADAYVRKVQEGAHRLTRDLLGKIETLQVVVAALEAEKATRSGPGHDLEGLASANEALRALVATLETEMNRLHEQVVALRADNERYRGEQTGLRAQLESIRAETRTYSSRCEDIERQNSNLANLYVASYRLHGTLDRKEVIDTIQEVVANLIGSEEAALFELDEDRKVLTLAAAFGVSAADYREVPLDRGPIGAAVLSAKVFVASDIPAVRPEGPEAALTACIPLVLDGRVTGAIAIFRLLPQKAGIEDLDRELFSLLATHAATALYCTRLHAIQAPSAAAS